MAAAIKLLHAQTIIAFSVALTLYPILVTWQRNEWYPRSVYTMAHLLRCTISSRVSYFMSRASNIILQCTLVQVTSSRMGCIYTLLKYASIRMPSKTLPHTCTIVLVTHLLPWTRHPICTHIDSMQIYIFTEASSPLSCSVGTYS